MDHRIFNTRVLNFVFRTTRAIPIASQREDPKLMQQALDSVAERPKCGRFGREFFPKVNSPEAVRLVGFVPVSSAS